MMTKCTINSEKLLAKQKIAYGSDGRNNKYIKIQTRKQA